MRIGVTSDIHSMTDDGTDVSATLYETFAGVDRIVACGDHTSDGVLGRLAELAPLVATANPAMPGDGGHYPTSERTSFLLGGRRFGVIFSLRQIGVPVTDEGTITWSASASAVANAFDEPLDVLLFGGTHQAFVGMWGSTLLVNPGSPRFALRTTAAVVEVHEPGGVVSATVIDV